MNEAEAAHKRKVIEHNLKQAEMLIDLAKEYLRTADMHFGYVEIKPRIKGRSGPCLDDEKAEIVRLHTEHGLGPTRIAGHMNRTYRTVEKVLRKAGYR